MEQGRVIAAGMTGGVTDTRMGIAPAQPRIPALVETATRMRESLDSLEKLAVELECTLNRVGHPPPEEVGKGGSIIPGNQAPHTTLDATLREQANDAAMLVSRLQTALNRLNSLV